ncbi:hypothetical protein BGX28_009340 [Mortierella sp. GBA30]|nr:hypothetical protein BGX28_009340 [Mortierella sp. GBA30]
MPATDSVPISAPIPVPGTQQEPTTPPVVIIPSMLSDSGATSPVNGATSSSSSSSSSSSPTAGGTPRTSMSSIRINSTLANAAGSGHLGALSPTNSNNSLQVGHHPHHHHLNNNPNSGLRRFPSIGNTKKLSIENSTLKAKISELERYLTGLKEELILAHRQVHAQRLEMKTLEERKSSEIHDLGQHIQRCEFELGAKVVECEGLQARLGESRKDQMAKIQEIEILKAEIDDIKVNKTTKKTSTDDDNQQKNKDSTATTTQGDRKIIEGNKEAEDRVRKLQDENTHKDSQIKELLEKVDHLGTEMLKLEREKARLERPVTPLPGDLEGDNTASATVDTETMGPNSNNNNSNNTLQDLIPITAEAIIAATTPHSDSTTTLNIQQSPMTNNNPSSVSGSGSSTSLSTMNSTVMTENQEAAQNQATLVNSVGYDLPSEHNKLLAKFQALRVQHAQASEYLDSLEGENRELKVQLLDVNVAH